MAVTLAVLAALTYGSADFLGGIASRRAPASVVVVLSQLAGVGVFVASLAIVPSHFHGSDLIWGALAGVGGAVGIAALYAALAIGRMGVVSPLTAVIGASVPVALGLALGERPPLAAMAGIGLAFVAVALVSADPQTLRLSFEEPGLVLAVVSGFGIGFMLVALSRSSPDSGVAALAPARVVSVLLLLLWARGRHESLRVPREALAVILCAGALDMGANVLYIVATHHGMLAVVAVITSLYPAATVFLARVFLRERLAALQWAGVACAVTGVVLIAR
jgi:drug/metabolite transporter (DMT)-like permease